MVDGSTGGTGYAADASFVVARALPVLGSRQADRLCGLGLRAGVLHSAPSTPGPWPTPPRCPAARPPLGLGSGHACCCWQGPPLLLGTRLVPSVPFFLSFALPLEFLFAWVGLFFSRPPWAQRVLPDFGPSWASSPAPRGPSAAERPDPASFLTWAPVAAVSGCAEAVSPPGS